MAKTVYPLVVPADLVSANDSTAKINPGTIVVDTSGNRFVYLKNEEAATALAAGDWVSYSSATGVKKNTASNVSKLPAGRTFSTTITAGYYGWFQIRGLISGLSGLTANEIVSIGGAAGQTVVNTPLGAAGELKAAVIGHAVSATSAYIALG